MILATLIPVFGMLGMLDEKRQVLSWTAPNQRDSLVVNVIEGRAYGGPTRTELIGHFQGKFLRKSLDCGSQARVQTLRGRTLFVIDNYAGTKDGSFFVAEYYRGRYKMILSGLRFYNQRVHFSKPEGTISSIWFDYETRRMLKGVWRIDVKRGRAEQVLCVPVVL